MYILLLQVLQHLKKVFKFLILNLKAAKNECLKLFAMAIKLSLIIF